MVQKQILISDDSRLLDPPSMVALPLTGMLVYVKYEHDQNLTIMRPSIGEKPKDPAIHAHLFTVPAESTHLLCFYGAQGLVVRHKILSGGYEQCLMRKVAKSKTGPAGLIGYCE